MELELVLPKELLESGCELTAEDAAQCADWQEEAPGRSDPSGTVGSETTRRNNRPPQTPAAQFKRPYRNCPDHTTCVSPHFVFRGSPDRDRTFIGTDLKLRWNAYCSFPGH